jgi:hypothetical protein
VALAMLAGSMVMGGAALLITNSHGKARSGTDRAASPLSVTIESKSARTTRTSEPPRRQYMPLVGSETGGPNDHDPRLQLHERLRSLPANRTLELRNETTLRKILAKTGGGTMVSIDSFFCRGNGCEAAFTFESVDQIRATLNELPFQDEWKEGNFGFNAIPAEPENPACLKFTVFFNSDPAHIGS